MGETWVGVRRSGSLEQRVCVKLISPELRNVPEVVRMFRREAALAASVRHGNLVQVVDVGDDGAYIAYELVDGTDLRTVLREASGHRLPGELVVYVLVEVCKALDYLHTRTQRGELSPIVHRDVSPSNILISHRGEVKLADLGIAKALREAERSEHVKGKVSYLSPEQANLQPVDGRTDLYALGVTAYQALSGTRPFAGESPEQILSQVIQGKATPLRHVARHASVGLVEVIETMMARRPQDRHATAMDVIRALAVNAPPPVLAFEKLGQHARHAQPHQTVHEDLSAHLEATRTAPADLQPPAPTVSSPASPAMHGVGHRSAHETRTTPPRSTSRRPGPLAWAAAFAATAGLGAVLFFSLATPQSPVQPGADGQDEAEMAPTVSNRKSPKSDPDEPQPQGRGQSPLQRGTPAQPEEAHRPRAAEDDRVVATTQEESTIQPKPSDEGAASDTTRPRTERAERTSARARPTGRLEIGAFPSGKIWIDGKLRGEAPLKVRLPAGRHRVAAGLQKPSETRRVRIRAGTTEQLVFNLRAQAEEEPP